MQSNCRIIANLAEQFRRFAVLCPCPSKHITSHAEIRDKPGIRRKENVAFSMDSYAREVVTAPNDYLTRFVFVLYTTMLCHRGDLEGACDAAAGWLIKCAAAGDLLE